MSDRKSGVLIKTMLFTGLAFAVNYAISLVLTPYIIESVGTDAYGFVSLAKNCAQYAMIITTALNSFASRYIAIEYHNNNIAKAKEYFSSVFWGNVGLGSCVLVVASICILFLDKILTISPAIVVDVKILFLLAFINFWITTVSSVYTAAAYIKNKLYISGIFKTLSYVAEAIVLISLYVLFPGKVFYVGFGLIALSLVIMLSNRWISRTYTPELSASHSLFSFAAVKRLVIDGIWASLNSLGNLLNSGLDLIVCNLLISPLAMGQVAVTKTIETIFAGLYQLVAQAFHPIFLRKYAVGDTDGLISELKQSIKVSGLLANLAFAGFLAFGLNYLNIWIPLEDTSLIYKLTLLTVVAGIATGSMTPLYYIYTLTVKIVFPCIVTIVGGIVNVVGMIILIKYTNLGIYSIVLTTTVIMSVINLITNPIYMAHVLKQKWWLFYPSIARNILSCIGISVALFGFSKLYQPSNWFELIVAILVSSAIGAVIHCCVVLNRSDWNRIKRIVLRTR